MSNKKKNSLRTPQVEAEAAVLFGKHVSAEKRRLLLWVTLIASALPMLLGVRLWDQIPAMVPSGLIGSSGTDDSLPRAVVAFGMPGLMCLMDLIAHFMLQFNQRRMTVPPAASRLVGRWGFPIISVLFCSGMTLQAAGGDLTLPFVTPCILGMALVLLGAHMWDCPRDAKIALRFAAAVSNEDVWKATHRFAGWVWMLVGLTVIAGAMLTSTSNWATAVLIAAALIAPAGYARARSRG